MTVQIEDFPRYGLPPTAGDLDRDWYRLEHLVQEALDASGNQFETQHVYHKICDGTAMFFPCPDAFVITEIIHYPNYRVLNIWLAAGDVTQIIDKVNDDVTNFGKSLGIYRQEFQGRRGWMSFARQNGWKPMQTTFKRDVRS